MGTSNNIIPRGSQIKESGLYSIADIGTSPTNERRWSWVVAQRDSAMASISISPGRERRRITVTGVVQGVGFRPFTYALARELGLSGSVGNTSAGVVVQVEGDPTDIATFLRRLASQTPPLAIVESITFDTIPARGGTEFIIEDSVAGIGRTMVSPDVATCAECRSDLTGPAGRRHRNPFVTCTNCGPRFTIITGLPYDRPNTTMAAFPMCDSCAAEYADPADRRFHAQPICCPDCGPRLRLVRPGVESSWDEAALAEARRLLLGGAVVAVKGIGGYHLACDATDETAVQTLRKRKGRGDKPFAVMLDSLGAAQTLANVDADSAALLTGPRRPIVLVERRTDPPYPDALRLAEAVAPGGPDLGIFLPYSPLHHLLFGTQGDPPGPRALVMTSGNLAGEPIVIDDDEALVRLSGLADAWLVHDRPIQVPCDDSVVRVLDGAELPIRRSRGYAPGGLPLPIAATRPIVAAGAQLKSTFCVARGREAYLSPHLGDLESDLALRAFDADLSLFLAMLSVQPEVVAHDLHPGYLATKWALEQEAELVGVQHHHAHAAACLAEHGREGPALAVVFDGTGLGTDGTLWGGEVLRCDLRSFERVAHLEPVPLPGGEAAIREPWRMAAVYLERAGRPVTWERWPLVRESLKVNAPLSSGMGRLFDAVAALLGLRERVSYEGQAAIELEQLAGEVEAEPYGCGVSGAVIAGSDLVRAAHDDLAAGRPAAEIAAAFHEGVAAAAALACAEAAEPRTIVLSGGTFQNLRLLASSRTRLEELGFEVLTHRRVPPNDGGISYGQAAVAAARTSRLSV